MCWLLDVLVTLSSELGQRPFKYAPTNNRSQLTIYYTETFRISIPYKVNTPKPSIYSPLTVDYLETFRIIPES
ncbi:MAG: hypothetical protein HLUCCA11_24010 [Phormidesmis priestleyi Ana]|uniref:Uncharacterized protein n=1 Tax=Phormidesmis priestleyi Ana TaxID=1666911 RepID=A0A0P7Z915_9CYAN|nr:MAG: hypothetical protein HLUCCA11_24010 [Phormidesmis priestleyi Ana]